MKNHVHTVFVPSLCMAKPLGALCVNSLNAAEGSTCSLISLHSPCDLFVYGETCRLRAIGTQLVHTKYTKRCAPTKIHKAVL